MASIDKMFKIDSHQHFWKYNPLQHSWINEDMRLLKRDFLPNHLEPILNTHLFNGCIAVQADQSEKENEFLLHQANQYDFIKGVVGWVDLQSSNLEARLQHYKLFKKMKGFRHVLQDEKQRDLMLNHHFMNGIKSLGKYGFTYDILIYPDQLVYAEKLVAANPDQLFVIDHMAKPTIRNKNIYPWSNDMRVIAKHRNVYCKISGMVTEADWKTKKPEDFVPYLDTIIDAFGVDRVMYGSDWPVCGLACSYSEVYEIVERYFSQFPEGDQVKFFGKNAMLFYKLQ